MKIFSRCKFLVRIFLLKKQRKLTFLFLIQICFFLSPQGHAGHFVGNGGDFIRAVYMRLGETILDYLKNTEQGRLITEKSKLDLATLLNTLDILKIKVVDDTLRDNAGSIVDAIGEPDKVLLNREAWFNHFEKSRDVYYLIFHEMLRSAGINDDNYVISANLNPFPVSRRVDTKIVPLINLIKEDLLADYINTSKVFVAGSGCPLRSGDLRVEFDQELNTIDISPSQFRNDVSEKRMQDYKACSLAIPAKIPAGKRLVISQIDLLGKIDISNGTHSKLSFEAFLAGTQIAIKTRELTTEAGTSNSSPFSTSLKGRVLTRRTDVLKSNCGGSDNIRINTNIGTTGMGVRDEFFELNKITLYLNLENCYE